MNSLKGKIIAIAIVLVIAVTAYGIGSVSLFGTQNATADTTVLYNSNTVASVYDTASPAVFQIQITESSTGIFGNSTQKGQGTGFLIDNLGHILTNNHVVEGASSIKLILQNGDTVEAKLLGTDSIDDLAVISIDASLVRDIKPLQFGNSDLVKPGQMAIAIGNPYGLDDTVTVGIISGLNRTVSGSNLRGMLQTDAALNPGNSGGPLLDAAGLVIGINTAIETSFSGATNIGFAVPSNVALNVLPELIAGNKITRPWLGISGRALTPSLAEELNLTVNEGVYVVSVTEGSPADQAGLVGSNLTVGGTPAKGGDVIIAVDGTAVKTVEAISNYLLTEKVGNTVTLSVLRNGSPLSIPVTLGTWPTTKATTETSPKIKPETTPDTLPNIPNMPGWNWRFNVR